MQKRNVHMLIEQVWHLGDLSPRLFLQKSTIMFFFGMIFFLKEIAFFFFWKHNFSCLFFLQLQIDTCLLHNF